MAKAVDNSKQEESVTKLSENDPVVSTGKLEAGKLSEENIYDLLDKIHDRTNKASALIFYYRCQACLFQQELDRDNFTIKDGYKILRQHVDFYRNALPLVLYMIEDCGSKEEVDLLLKHVESTRSYESDITLQHLNLWRMLTDIATELSESEDDVRELVSIVGHMIRKNSEHIVVNEQYSLASALEAFRHLEKKGKLEPMLKVHPAELRKGLCLYDILNRLHKQKLLNDYVNVFSPNLPLTLAVLEVESKSYRVED